MKMPYRPRESKRSQPDFLGAAPWIEVVVYVAGVAALYDELRGSGARVVHELGERPWGTRDFTVEDPDGFRLIFTEAPEEW